MKVETSADVVERLVNDGNGRPVSDLSATAKQRRYWHLISLKDSKGQQLWTYKEAAHIAAEEGEQV